MIACSPQEAQQTGMGLPMLHGNAGGSSSRTGCIATHTLPLAADSNLAGSMDACALPAAECTPSQTQVASCRWKKSLVNKVVRANKHWNDASVSPVVRQTLLHWAYELTEADFDRIREEL